MATSTLVTGDATAVRRDAAGANHAVSPPSSVGLPGLRPRAVVVHSGARDGYQVARALENQGLLDALVTDLFWPQDRRWAHMLLALLPAWLRAQLLQRSAPLSSRRVRALSLRGLATLALDKLPRAPFAWRRSLMRATDAALGRAAGQLARRTGGTLVTYSYYGYHAFSACQAPGILFQLHPHPASMRRILLAELAAHPECAGSLEREWELALPEDDFARLVAEPAMAAHLFVASSFTRETLVEHGTPGDAITVIPYGVDCARFSPGPSRQPSPGTLRLLFVGRINQRKGIQYLLESLRLLRPAGDSLPAVHLTVCGRVVDGLGLFAPLGSQVTVRPDVSADELLAAYREADLFVFPSIAEGFGQVLLEALACGLPILSTTRTAAPDLIEEGVEGFVVEPGDPVALALRIEWARTHPEQLEAMRGAARRRAAQFTWERFRERLAAAFAEVTASFPAPAASTPRDASTRRRTHV